jgi:hypothetical protein
MARMRREFLQFTGDEKAEISKDNREFVVGLE